MTHANSPADGEEFESKKTMARLLADIMAGPPVTAHADINANALILLLTTADRSRGVRVCGSARKALEAAGWDLDEYRGHPVASHVVFHGGQSYLMNLTAKQTVVA